MECETTDMSEKHEVDIAVIKNDVARMKDDINGLKVSQADHGKRLEMLQSSLSELTAKIQSWGVGIVVAISLLELFLKFYLR